MKSRKDEVLEALRANPNEQTAQELADQMGVDRTNVSRCIRLFLARLERVRQCLRNVCIVLLFQLRS